MTLRYPVNIFFRPLFSCLANPHRGTVHPMGKQKLIIHSDALEEVRERLMRFKGQWARIARMSGVSYHYVRKVAMGRADPSFTYLERIARCAGLRVKFVQVSPLDELELPGKVSQVELKVYRPEPKRDPHTIDLVDGLTDQERAATPAQEPAWVKIYGGG